MSYGSTYGGYYGGRGPVRQNEARTRPSWNTKYNGFGGYGGSGDQDYNYAQVPGLSYNGAYGSYGGYGLQGYGPLPTGYGASLPLYGAGGPAYATTPPMMYPNFVANSASLPGQLQQPLLYSNNISGNESNNPPTTGITNPTRSWPAQ